uniref:Domain of unknown function DB domain-containing protein n=1 Tax=Panagrellus redivivus TaxID=6233 RepID=A0A7E4ZTX8_PANRE
MKLLPTLCLIVFGFVLVSVEAAQKHKGLAAAAATTTTTEKPDDSAESEGSDNVIEEPVEANKDGQIRQCSCDEMESCFKEQKAKHEPCAEKCLDELKFGEGDATAAKKCFHKNHEDIHSCRKNAAQKFCAADKNTFIPESEAYKGGRRRGGHGHRKDSNATTTESDGASTNDLSPIQFHKRRGTFGFHTFLKANFGEAGGKAYMKCQRKCYQGRRRSTCFKKLGCGLKRFEKKDLEAAHITCKDQEEEKKQQLCDCLTAAGVKNVVCNFESGKKPKN